MDAPTLLRGQFKEAHNLLEMVLKDTTPEQLHWTPNGNANPIGATVSHILTAEDALLGGMVAGGAPLFTGDWGAKMGLSAPPPPPGESWAEWARSVKIDGQALHEYGQAVFAQTDGYLASIKDGELEREIDLSGFQLGKQQVGWFVSTIILSHVGTHCGEVACMKGMQGGKGYPF